MGKSKLSRNNLPFDQIVFLFLYSIKDKTAILNTEHNAREIIRDPINFTHHQDIYSSKQSRNHMYNCRDHHRKYYNQFVSINHKFETYYSLNERELLFDQANQFIIQKRIKQKQEQYW